MNETKTCSTCGIAKPLAEFRAYVRAGKTYYRYTCRECRNAKNRERYSERVSSPPTVMLPLAEFSVQVCRTCKQELPLDQFGPNMAMRVGRKRDCKKCLADYASRWVDQNPEKAFDTYLRRTYGLTLERYSELLAEQGGCCAICGEPPTVQNSGRWTRKRRRPAPPKLVVDHDHETGKVRGLLCGMCNAGLGHLKDSLDVLRFAIKYLEERG